MKTVWQRLAELIDAGALGAPRRRQRAAHVAGRQADAAAAEDAPAPLEVRDVALPHQRDRGGEAARRARPGHARRGRALERPPGAQRPRRAARPGHRGRRGRARRARAGGTCSPRRRSPRSSTRLFAQPVLGHNVKELMRSLAAARHRRDRPRDGHRRRAPTSSTPRPASTSSSSCASRRASSSLDILEPGEGAADVAKEAAGEASDVFGMAHTLPHEAHGRRHGRAARRHRAPPRPGPRQDGGRRHRRRPRRAPVDHRRAQGVRRHAPGRGAGARRARVQRELDAAAAHRALRGARPHPGQEDEDRLLDRRGTRLENMRDEHPIIETLLRLPRGREAALDVRREPVGRGAGRRAHPRVVRPDRRPHRPHLVGPPEPAQHPGAQRPGQAVPARLRARRGLQLPRGGLRPGRAALHRAPLRGPGPRSTP